MKPTNEELFALSKIFFRKDIFDIEITNKLNNIEVIERKNTIVGFFSLIRFKNKLPDVSRRQWDWNFNHRDLKYGGSFMAYFKPPDLIELEAVVHDGNWPINFDPTAFVESV